MHTQMQTGVEVQSTEKHLSWKTQDGVSNIARVDEGSELSNVIERIERVLRCGDDDGRGTAPPTTPGILELAASSSERGADPSSTLKRDSCGFKRHTRKES